MGDRSVVIEDRALRVAGGVHPRRTVARLRQVADPGDRRAARAMAYRALARRARSAAWLRERLCRAGYDEMTVATVLTELAAAGYVDDRAFARDWARACIERKGLGRKGLRLELERQGVPRAIVAETLEALYRGVDERDLAARLVARWLRPTSASSRALSGPERMKTLRRVRDRLLRRGFSFEIVGSVVASVLTAAGRKAPADQEFRP